MIGDVTDTPDSAADSAAEDAAEAAAPAETVEPVAAESAPSAYGPFAYLSAPNAPARGVAVEEEAVADLLAADVLAG